LSEKLSVSELESTSLAGFLAFIWFNLCTRHKYAKDLTVDLDPYTVAVLEVRRNEFTSENPSHSAFEGESDLTR
jgi:hypothetical protein